MSVRLKTSLGTAMIQAIPFGNVPQSEYPGHPAVGREIRAWPRTARTHVYTHTHTLTRARIHYTYTRPVSSAPPPPRGGSLSL